MMGRLIWAVVLSVLIVVGLAAVGWAIWLIWATAGGPR